MPFIIRVCHSIFNCNPSGSCKSFSGVSLMSRTAALQERKAQSLAEPLPPIKSKKRRDRNAPPVIAISKHPFVCLCFSNKVF
jgi:hypothetical protein